MDTNPYSRLMSGIAVGPSRAPGLNGTLTAIVRDNLRPDRLMMLSCYHVLAVDRSANDDDIICQPSESGRTVAHLTAKRFVTSKVDAALAVVDNPNPGNWTNEIVEMQVPITGVAFGSGKGTHVRKRGISTGISSGHIVDTNQTIHVGYGNIVDPWPLNDQLQIQGDPPSEPFSRGGDSGSAVINDNNQLIGLLVGGDESHSYATPIEYIISQLQISIPP
jgi:hypothetical protein